MTPTKLTRLEEKNTLIGLNNRLANILDKNRQLELENSKLNGQVRLINGLFLFFYYFFN